MLGGNAYYMSEFFMTPTPDATLNRPSQVLFFRVDPALQATAQLSNGVNPILDLKSTRWGAYANQLARKVYAGSTVGKHVVVKLAGSQIVDQDNISLSYLTIQYIGSGSAAVLTINGTQLQTVVTAGATGESFTLLFANFPTVGSLVKYINDQPGYTCQLNGNQDADATTMDAVTAQDVKTAPYTAKADVEALIQFFNGNSGGEITAALHAAAVRTIPDNDSAFVFFASGSDGTVSNTDWSNCLSLREKFGINHVLAATGDASKHALVSAHCQKMSDIDGKKNRSWGAGAVLATSTKSARIAEAKALADARGEYWSVPFYRYDNAAGGVRRLFDGFYGAALGAGIRFGNFITIAAVYKQPNILGTSESYSVTDMNDYIKNGCSVMGLAESGNYEIIHNTTTYQGSNEILTHPSALRTCDFITLDSQLKLRTKVAAFDRAPNSIMLKALENYCTSSLLPGYRDEGLLTDDPNTGAPAFSGVSFTFEGDTFWFEFTGIVPVPLLYGFIRQKFIVVGQK
jgi:hypothetical protein